MGTIEKTLDNFLGDQNPEVTIDNDFLQIKEKDGIVERVNKTVIVEDGRQILEG